MSRQPQLANFSKTICKTDCLSVFSRSKHKNGVTGSPSIERLLCLCEFPRSVSGEECLQLLGAPAKQRALLGSYSTVSPNEELLLENFRSKTT